MGSPSDSVYNCQNSTHRLVPTACGFLNHIAVVHPHAADALTAHREPLYTPVGYQKGTLYGERENGRPARLAGFHGAANARHPRPPTWLGNRPPHRADQRRRAGVESGDVVPGASAPATD